MNKQVARLKIALTTGDEDGIGLEVATKALLFIDVKRLKSHQIVLYRSSYKSRPWIQLLKDKYRVLTLVHDNNFFQRFKSEDLSKYDIIDVLSISPPSYWVEEAARGCMAHDYHGLVTGPLSKPGIISSGLKDLGHTPILQRISGSPFVTMGFLGKNFNVVLATGHIPIRQIRSRISQKLLNVALLHTEELVSTLSPRSQKKPIALVGLNPHAGDMGLLGQEEQTIFAEVLKSAIKRKVNIVGPLVPDAAFLPDRWDHYSAYLASYHDQGLIPFKMSHRHSGTQVSLGLPFVRTSVDHGTAKDIFGKDLAKFQSMLDSIKWCIKLSLKK